MQGKQVRHREQPFFTDAEIETIVGNTTNPSWRRVFALMAVYGLRPWQAWIAEPSGQYAKCARIPIGKKNSKGQNPPRDVPPFHPHWCEQFRIERLWSTPLPALNELSQAGHRSTKQLQRYGFCQEQSQASTRKAAYGFRHAYARRIHTEAYRVTDTHGALFMGYTTDNHNKQYRRWIDGQVDPFRACQPRT